MGYHEDHENARAYRHYHEKPKHEAHLSHELMAGAASYYAAKAYEEHVAKNGKPPNHAKAKELFAGFAGAFLDREFEKHGMNFIDKEKAKHHARQHAEQFQY